MSVSIDGRLQRLSLQKTTDIKLQTFTTRNFTLLPIIQHLGHRSSHIYTALHRYTNINIFTYTVLYTDLHIFTLLYTDFHGLPLV